MRVDCGRAPSYASERRSVGAVASRGQYAAGVTNVPTPALVLGSATHSETNLD